MLGEHRVIVHDPRWADVTGVSAGDVVVLAQGGDHAEMAIGLLRRGLHVVTVGDSLDDSRTLFAGGDAVAASGVTLVVGAAMSPGLSGLIALSLDHHRPRSHAGKLPRPHTAPTSHARAR